MLIFVRYTKGLGNTTVYGRFRNELGQYYDFGSNSWRADEHFDTKLFLTELTDADTLESTYVKVVTPPGGLNDNTIIEVVDGLSALVVAQESYVLYLNRAVLTNFRFDSDGHVFASPFSNVVLPTLTGAVYSPTVTYGALVKIVQYDTPTLTFNLNSDYTTWDLKLYYKLDGEEETPQMKECVWVNATLGHGSVEFTSLNTNTIGTYQCELKVIKASKILTVMKFTLTIQEGLTI